MDDIHSCSYYCDLPECIKAQRDELRDRLAQPEQEPVAWMTQAHCFVHLNEFTEAEAKLYGWTPLYTSPPQHDKVQRLSALVRAQQITIDTLEAQSEPVAWANPNDLQNFDMKVRTNGGPLHTVPLYTTPPQRTEQNFCPRCGKRNKDIHTCTPPQEGT